MGTLTGNAGTKGDMFLCEVCGAEQCRRKHGKRCTGNRNSGGSSVPETHTSMAGWMATECNFHPYVGGEIALMGGAARTEGEINQFEWVVQTYQPRIAVIMVPLGLELGGKTWGHIYIVDSAQHGDVLAGVWQIGMKNLVPISCFAEEPVNHPLRTIYDRYRQCEIIPCGDGRGIVDVNEVPYSVGLEVRIRSDVGIRTLSLNSHIKMSSLSDLRENGIQLPWCWGKDDLPRKVTHGETCAVLGNAMRLKEIGRYSSVEIDARCRSTPLVLRKKVPHEVFGTYDFLNMDTYETGSMPRDELEEEDEICPRLEFLETLGVKPPPQRPITHQTHMRWVEKEKKRRVETTVIGWERKDKAKLHSGARVVGYSPRAAMSVRRRSHRFTV